MFFNSHQNVITACDFATYELVTPHGLQREHILFFENVFTREVWLGGIVHDPNGNWMRRLPEICVICGMESCWGRSILSMTAIRCFVNASKILFIPRYLLLFLSFFVVMPLFRCYIKELPEICGENVQVD